MYHLKQNIRFTLNRLLLSFILCTLEKQKKNTCLISLQWLSARQRYSYDKILFLFYISFFFFFFPTLILCQHQS